MPTWIAAGNGTWTDPANWSGGVPAASGSTADFNFATNVGGTIIVGIPEFSDIRVGIMNITMTGTTGLVIRGSLTDSGTDIGDLIFDNGASTALLNITTLATTSPTTFSSTAGLRVTLASNTNVNVVTSGSIARFDIPILGTGKLIKSGSGILELNGSNSFSGGIDVTGGILDAVGDAALGSGTVTISNSATFRSVGSTNQIFATVLNVASIAGSGVIAAAAATTLTLTGTLSHLSQGTMNFGSVTDTGTVIASFGSILENATNSSFRIDGGTLRFGNAFNAANLLLHPGAGLTEISTGAILDTAGFATAISNLDFDGGTLRTSVGTLNVTVNDVFSANNAQGGTLEGTAGVDQLTINAQFGFNLSQLTLTNWTAGTDLITINGSANNNDLTGTSGRDTLNGLDGDDTLTGGGGIDTFNGGNGNDFIILSASGSFVDGGANTDTLQLINGTVSVGSIAGIEAVDIANGANLILTGTQFATGLANNTALTGLGTITVNMTAGVNFLASGMNFASSLTTVVNGTSGLDIIKLGLGTSTNNTVNGGDGVDQIRGSNGVDTIIGGIGNDKIMSLGGADILTGGVGSDQFRYFSASDSGLGANADRITDFLSGTDRLNFLLIDPDPFTAGDQAFVFVDTVGFTNNGIAQIRWVDLGADLRIEADVNGDGVSDMHILLQGAGAQVLSAADFIL